VTGARRALPEDLAGLVTRDIFDRENLVERAAALTPAFLSGLEALEDLAVVTDIRGYGLLGGIDMAPLDAPGVRGLAVMQQLYDAGLMVKLTGDTVLLSPPLVSEDKHIDELFSKLRGVLQAQ
ncbi:MAG: aminotransferase class III-fold pyridoxal phosphate-dependent enzyme, partial [Kiloniellaceae bacterium]